MYDDDGDENDDYMVSCPHCGEPMYDDSPRCPACGDYVTSADFNQRFPRWLIWVVVLVIVSFLLPTLLPFLAGIEEFFGQN